MKHPSHLNVAAEAVRDDLRGERFEASDDDDDVFGTCSVDGAKIHEAAAISEAARPPQQPASSERRGDRSGDRGAERVGLMGERPVG